MRVAALCSGYGGLERGVELVEPVEVIWHAEIEPAAAQVHAHHWPSAPNVGDIKAAPWADLETPDLLTAGYPCQPFSHAGRRQGTDDERHLWPHVADAVRVLRPRRVLLENVAGHLSLGFDVVLADLAALGYDARWGCVRASDAGAPHRRERLFVVATDTGRERHGRIEVDRVVGRLDSPDEGTERQRQRAREVAERRSAASPTDSARGRVEDEPLGSHPSRLDERAVDRAGDRDRSGGVAEGVRELGRAAPGVAWGPFDPAIRRWEYLTRPAPPPTDDRGRLSPLFVEWMMGLPDGWVTGHGLPRTAELRMLGNGVVPQAAAIAWGVLA